MAGNGNYPRVTGNNRLKTRPLQKLWYQQCQFLKMIRVLALSAGFGIDRILLAINVSIWWTDLIKQQSPLFRFTHLKVNNTISIKC